MNYQYKSVLFLGIGGISMHQIALCFKDMGAIVYGYDSKNSKYTDICKSAGITVTNRFNKNFLNVDLCIKTGAIKDSDKYLRAVRNLNIPVLDRSEALGFLCSKFKTVVAVAGTHGKSTTASLIYEILRVAGKSVSCHIGADVFASRFNLNDEILVVEACEYNKSFLSIYPTISVVTNVEPEHLDSYGNFYNLKNAFSTFVKRGKIRIISKENSTKFLNSIKNVDNVEILPNINTKLKGEYNLKNISLAVAVAKKFNVDDKTIEKVISNFKGIPRRYEHIGDFKNTKIYIDYAHHPTEINSFVKTFQQEYKNCLIVFQPHTYSRTKFFINEFVSVLSEVKNLVLFKEYPAREMKSDGMSCFELFQILKSCNENVEYISKSSEINKKINGFEAVAFVGAGDIDKIAAKIVKRN